MKSSPILTGILGLISLSLPACDLHKEQSPGEAQQKIVLTSPMAKDVEITLPYVCQIHSQRHINVRALQSGYLEEILVKEGQPVKEGDVMFRILPTLYKARYKAAEAKAQFARLQYNNTYSLFKKNVVSENQVALVQADLERAEADAEQAKAELDFCVVRARFDGIVDTLQEQLGSMIKERDILTTLSDNSVMWVYFYVPEARYYEYQALQPRAYQYQTVEGKSQDHSQFLELVDSRIELRRADGNTFKDAAGRIITAPNIVTVTGQFDNKTGNIAFRADFPNPDRLLRHGQTGTVLVYRTLHNALVIPQRAVFELLDKQYVYVIDDKGEAHQRLIVPQYELEDIFVIKEGLKGNDRIVLEGIRQLSEGAKVEKYDYRKPEQVLADQKNPAQ